MAPSNMRLRVDRVDGYNNQIVIATVKQKIGHNGNMNADIIKRTAVLAHGTDFIKPQAPATTQSSPASSDVVAQSEITAAGTDAHETERLWLVVALVAIGLFALWF